MKKFLSLALALVMLLGIMPMAMATEVGSGTETPSHSHDVTWEWVDAPDAEGYEAATCTTEGTMPQKCSVEGCTATNTRAIEALGHVDADGNRVCDREGCETAITYTASASPVNVNVNGTATIAVTYSSTMVSNTTLAGVTPSYSVKSGADCISVSGSTVTGLKIGTGVVAISFGDSGISPIECTVTVTDGVGVLSCGSTTQSTSGSSVTITPSFTLNGQSASATYAYELTGSCATLSAASGSSTLVKKSSAGVVYVKVTVTGYTTSAGVAATAAELAKVAPVTVAISFYENVDAEVTVKSGVSSFLFDDVDVFSSGTIDGTQYAKPATLCMANTYTYRGNGSENWANHSVTFYPSVASSTVGTISYTGILASDFGSGVSYTFSKSQDLKFTCIGKGTYTMDYTLESAGLTLQMGTIKITVKSAESSITYKTTYGKSVTLNEKDFATFWKAAKMSSDLSYVMFDITSTTPYYGTLYTTGSTSTQKAATASMKFYYNASSSDTYDLDAVTFVPGTKKTSYTEEIPFTCFGKTSSEKLSGVMTIKVGETVTFTDVKSSEYYYDAVLWAVDEGITTGTSNTTFSPDMECDRSQVVTFLWRAAGEPEPTTSYMPFTDVKKDDFYYDAVLWAVENGITEGTSKTTFSPRMTVTRGQVVTFLWRAMGEKSVSSVNPFTDVKSSEYYYDAVLWAVKNEITEGMSATSFMPDRSCVRGQIVTFLYRAYVEE